MPPDRSLGIAGAGVSFVKVDLHAIDAPRYNLRRAASGVLHAKGEKGKQRGRDPQGATPGKRTRETLWRLGV
jgi:hypothetical protein